MMELVAALAMFLGMLQVLKVTEFVGKPDEVGEDHASKAHMIDRTNGAGLDVLGAIVVQTSLNNLLEKGIPHRDCIGLIADNFAVV